MSQILVVDDEIGIRELLSEILSDEGHQVRLAQNAAEARQIRSRNRPDLVLLDIWMPDTDGITLLREWAAAGQLTMPVVMMSGHGTIETAVEATRIGAYAFLEKPVAMQKLLVTVGKALAQQATAAASQPAHSLAFLGRATVVSDLRERLERVRDLRSAVLLTGEPGCGKGLCARYLHRANTAWVAPESADFLHDPERRDLAAAADGTLFLRRVDRLAPADQQALARCLPALEQSNTRVVSTASADLPQRVADGAFDSSLYAALAAISLRVPALAEHPEDVPEIAKLILDRLSESRAVPARRFGTAALNQLRLCRWPGNLTQLESVVRSAALVSDGTEIGPADVSVTLNRMPDPPNSTLGGLVVDTDLRSARDAFERAYFSYHVAREGGNMSRVADRAGLERTHLYRKLKQLGIPLPRKPES